MKKFGYVGKEVQLRFYGAMEGKKVPNGETLQSMMEDIQTLLDACYSLGINPLRELRKILPQYSWKYWVIKRGLPRTTISQSDFIWNVDWFGVHEEFHFVTATKLERREPLKYFWAGDIDTGNPRASTEHVDFVEALGGNPVYWITQ